jgi:hypothetical protein
MIRDESMWSSSIPYHGDTALLVTFEDGESSVLLIGCDLSDVPDLIYDIFP